MEALKMSHTTLQDFYQGMKMPTYDGSNIYSQIRKFNEDVVTKNTRMDSLANRGFEHSFGK